MREDAIRTVAGRIDPRLPTTGIGLRAPHIDAVLSQRPPAPFLEVHAENHMGDGRAFRTLERVRGDYKVSIHGVGLSLGSPEPPEERHLARFADLVARIQPMLVSEHLSWCRAGGFYLNDLLPVRYDRATLDHMVRNVDIVQQAIGRTLLIENPSRYLDCEGAEMSETDFLAALCRRSGCGVLLDVNNVYVSACNLDVDPGSELDGYLCVLPPGIVGEIHLAGHARVMRDAVELLIDDHGSPVVAPVWQLYERALASLGRVPTLIEWDTALPGFGVLVAEAGRAQMRLDALEERHACVA